MLGERMSRPARACCCTSVLALVLATGCGSSGPTARRRAQIVAASQAPWQAVNKRDARGFCASVTPTLWTQLLRFDAAVTAVEGPGLCQQEAAGQIRSGRLGWVANAALKEQDPRRVVRLTISGSRATLTFRGQPVTLRQDNGGRRGGGPGQQTLTIAVPAKALVEVDLVADDHRRWRVTAVTSTQIPRTAISSAGKPLSGFSETFYAYVSQANSNGSAFAGYTGSTVAERSRVDFLAQVFELSYALQVAEPPRPRVSRSTRPQRGETAATSTRR
jgi:hypothetical protein